MPEMVSPNLSVGNIPLCIIRLNIIIVYHILPHICSYSTAKSHHDINNVDVFPWHAFTQYLKLSRWLSCQIAPNVTVKSEIRVS